MRSASMPYRLAIAAQISCSVAMESMSRISKTSSFASSVMARTGAVSPSTLAMLSIMASALSALPLATSSNRFPLMVRRTLDTQLSRSENCLSSLRVTMTNTSL